MSARSETPVVTHDGRIWPVARDAMTCPAAITLRMAEDLNALRRAHEGVSYAALARLGWPQAAIQRHLPAAIDRASAAFDDDARRDRLNPIAALAHTARALAGDAIETGALALFVAGIWAAGAMMGAPT